MALVTYRQNHSTPYTKSTLSRSSIVNFYMDNLLSHPGCPHCRPDLCTDSTLSLKQSASRLARLLPDDLCMTLRGQDAHNLKHSHSPTLTVRRPVEGFPLVHSAFSTDTKRMAMASLNLAQNTSAHVRTFVSNPQLYAYKCVGTGAHAHALRTTPVRSEMQTKVHSG